MSTPITKTALVALAGEQVGAAQRTFDITIEYLKTRYQFGQQIGGFQALKHIAADLLVELESASSAARHAARSIASGGDDQKAMAFLAGFTCADNFRKISAEAIQLHGGIAYTMEHTAHLFWRRAQTGQWLYCSSDSLRELYLQEILHQRYYRSLTLPGAKIKLVQAPAQSFHPILSEKGFAPEDHSGYAPMAGLR